MLNKNATHMGVHHYSNELYDLQQHRHVYSSKPVNAKSYMTRTTTRIIDYSVETVHTSPEDF